MAVRVEAATFELPQRFVLPHYPPEIVLYTKPEEVVTAENEYKLQTNPAMKLLASILRNSCGGYFKRGIERTDGSMPKGYLLEELVRDKLVQIAKIKNSIRIPLLDEVESTHYHFHQNRKGINVEKKGDPLGSSEYDAIVLCQGKDEEGKDEWLPVIIEVKSGKQLEKKKLRARSIVNKLEPIKELFQTDRVGFIVVVTKDCRGRKKDFTDRGGLFATLPITTEELAAVSKPLDNYPVAVL
jgi:hypothetical protein